MQKHTNRLKSNIKPIKICYSFAWRAKTHKAERIYCTKNNAPRHGEPVVCLRDQNAAETAKDIAQDQETGIALSLPLIALLVMCAVCDFEVDAELSRLGLLLLLYIGPCMKRSKQDNRMVEPNNNAIQVCATFE